MVSRGARTALVIAPAKAPLRNSPTSLDFTTSCIHQSMFVITNNRTHISAIQQTTDSDFSHIFSVHSKIKLNLPTHQTYIPFHGQKKKKKQIMIYRKGTKFIKDFQIEKDNDS